MIILLNFLIYWKSESWSFDAIEATIKVFEKTLFLKQLNYYPQEELFIDLSQIFFICNVQQTGYLLYRLEFFFFPDFLDLKCVESTEIASLRFYQYNINQSSMQVINFEENCEDEHQFDNQLHDFTKKTLKVRFMDQLNKTINKAPIKEGINLQHPQRRTIRESTQIYHISVHAAKKHLSLDQTLINSQNTIFSTSSPLPKMKNARKKLTIQKKLKNCNLLDGDGIARLSQGEAIFATWKNGDACGEVKIVYPSGNIYIGSVKNYLRHGYGMFFFKGGNKFQGYFKGGRIDGVGEFTDVNGELISKGLWRNGYFIQNIS